MHRYALASIRQHMLQGRATEQHFEKVAGIGIYLT